MVFAGLRVFGFLRKGSTKLQLLTSMATYIGYEGGAAVIDGKTVGFMGSRAMSGGRLRDPIAVIVPPQSAWKWKQVTGFHAVVAM